MIAAARSGSPVTGPGTRRPAAACARPGAAPPPRPRPRPTPNRPTTARAAAPRASTPSSATGRPPPAAGLAADAARGFSAGNGYLTGLIVDRLA